MRFSLSLAALLVCGSVTAWAQPSDPSATAETDAAVSASTASATATASSASASDATASTSDATASTQATATRGAAAASATAGTKADPDVVKSITHAFETHFPGIEVDGVRTTPMDGLFEVQVGTDVLYTDASGDYVLQGSLVDAKARKDLTAERLEEIQRVAFDTLPLDDAIRLVKGNGTRKLATFEDPNCPYCKQLHKALENVDDVTVYTFLYPILSADSMTKSRDIWCADDPAKAWTDWMVRGVKPAEAKCDTPFQENLALGRKLNVQGTPALFFADGARVNGVLPLEALKERLDAQGS